MGRQRPAVQRVAGMFAQEPLPDFDVPGRREPGERPELVAEVDKTFGWGYATPSDRAWVEGGSPTRGFLGEVAAGPLESTFHDWAGERLG